MVMKTSTILINGSNVDKQKLLQLINNGQKIEALKYVKAVTRLGLKQSKSIVDNLADDPYYYEDDVVEISQNLSPGKSIESDPVQMKRPSKKGNHVLQTGSSIAKNYMAIGLALIAAIVLYFLLR